MDPIKLLTLSHNLADNIGLVWTFLLVSTRFLGFFSLVPGIGMGVAGLAVRGPAIIVLSFVSLYSSALAPVPGDFILMAAALGSEYMLGAILGMIPMMIVAGVQNAVQLASTTMGLGMGNLIDPTLGIQSSDVARIFGDVSIITFLLLGGHHVVVHAVAGMGGMIVPGSFVLSDITLDLLVNRSAEIFKCGIILSAPVVVALLLTNFVMGLITKAVPTVNIFIVSFPLTIGIGLILMGLAFPDISIEFTRQVTGLENQVLEVLKDTTSVPR